MDITGYIQDIPGYWISENAIISVHIHIHSHLVSGAKWLTRSLPTPSQRQDDAATTTRGRKKTREVNPNEFVGMKVQIKWYMYSTIGTERAVSPPGANKRKVR